MHKPGSTQHPSELGTKPVAGPAAWLEPQCEGQRPGVQTQQPNADALSPSDRQTCHQLAIAPLSCGLPLNAEGFKGSPKPGNASGLEPRPPPRGLCSATCWAIPVGRVLVLRMALPHSPAPPRGMWGKGGRGKRCPLCRWGRVTPMTS